MTYCMAKQQSSFILLFVLLHLYLLNAIFCLFQSAFHGTLKTFSLAVSSPQPASDADQILPTMQLIPALTLLLQSQTSLILKLMSFEMTVWLTLKWVWLLWVLQGLDCLHTHCYCGVGVVEVAQTICFRTAFVVL